MTSVEKIVKMEVIPISAILGVGILLSANILTASPEYLWGQQMVTNSNVSENVIIPKIIMNTSLGQAIMTAEQVVGNNSFAIAAFGSDHGGNIVYTIILTSGTEFYSVTINPGNGQVLATEELSKNELEKMHLAHSQKVLDEPHLMNNTFGH